MESSQKRIFWETIQLLNDMKALPYLMVVGSWAEYLYEESRLIPGYRSLFRTQDFDVLLTNLRRPDARVDLVGEFERRGYLFLQNPHTGLMKFDKGGELEVEFLVRELGAGQTEPYLHRGFGVTAQGLRYLEILSKYSIALAIRGFSVSVPLPQAYVLHKMLIHERRSEAKKEKDSRAVIELHAAIQQLPNELARFHQIFTELPKNARTQIRKTADKFKIPIALRAGGVD